MSRLSSRVWWSRSETKRVPISFWEECWVWGWFQGEDDAWLLMSAWAWRSEWQNLYSRFIISVPNYLFTWKRALTLFEDMRRIWTTLKTQSCIFTFLCNQGPVGERERGRNSSTEACILEIVDLTADQQPQTNYSQANISLGHNPLSPGEMENHDLELISIWAFHWDSLGLIDFCTLASNPLLSPVTSSSKLRRKGILGRGERKKMSEARARTSDTVREKMVGMGLK